MEIFYTAEKKHSDTRARRRSDVIMKLYVVGAQLEVTDDVSPITIGNMTFDENRAMITRSRLVVRIRWRLKVLLH